MPAPDGWDRLWTPHRLAYVAGEGKPDADHAGPGDGCPFCRAPSDDEAESLVVARGARVYAVLNKYPYNPGHLLICPYRHVAGYVELEPGELDEFTDFTRRALRMISSVSHPNGFNVGMNQGMAAGAGIAAHLHQHVVPRWGGDTNFMPIVGKTRVLPQLLTETRDLFRAAWPDA